MKKEAGKKEVNERLLFHGTKDARLEDICINNFDWRTCGSNGANYGKGMQEMTECQTSEPPDFEVFKDEDTPPKINK